MSSDPNDELARFRSRRNRDRPSAEPGTADAAPTSTEQDEALARARESWTLSQLGREANSQRRRDEAGQSGPVDEASGTPGEDN